MYLPKYRDVLINLPGEMSKLIANKDWSLTPIGPLEDWPSSLKSMVNYILGSPWAHIIYWGPELTAIYNDAYRPLLGIKENSLGKSLPEIWSESWSIVRLVASKALSGEASYFQNAGFTLFRKGFPEEAWFDYSYSPVRDESGKVVGILNTAVEKTEQVLADQARIRSESILKHAGLMANLGAWEIEFKYWDDVNKNDLFWSEEVFRIFGYTPNSVPVSNDLFFNHVHPDDRKNISETLQKAMVSKRPYTIEHRIIRRDGIERVVVEYAEIFFNGDRPSRIVGAVQDITEQKAIHTKLLQALAQAEEERSILTALMEHIPMGITIADAPQMKIRMISKYGQNIFERAVAENVIPNGSPNNFEGRIFRADGVTPGRPEELPLVRATSSGEIIKNEEWSFLKEDGTLISILSNAAPILDNKGNIRGGVVGWQDITERKQMEIAIRESEIRLRTLNENLENLIEKRTEQVRSLSVALTLAEQIERKYFSYMIHEKLHQNLLGTRMLLKQYIREQQDKKYSVVKTAASLEDLEEALLVLEKALQTTKILSIELNPPVLRSEGLNKALEWLVNHLNKNYQFKVNLQIEGPVNTIKNEPQVLLTQMVQELLKNVKQHAGVSTAILKVSYVKKQIKIVLSDDGKGFDPQKVLNIKLNPNQSRLYIISERLKQLGGDLSIKSGQDQGTEVTIFYPQ